MVGARLEGEASALLVRIFRRAAPTRKPNTEFLQRSEEHTSELQSQSNLVCRLLLEKKKNGRASLRARSLLPLNRLRRSRGCGVGACPHLGRAGGRRRPPLLVLSPQSLPLPASARMV